MCTVPVVLFLKNVTPYNIILVGTYILGREIGILLYVHDTVLQCALRTGTVSYRERLIKSIHTCTYIVYYVVNVLDNV